MNIEALTSQDFEVRQTEPKIVCYDIETSPAIVATWRKFDANALWVEEYPQIICFSAKYLDGKQITRSLPDYEGYEPGKLDDREICRELYGILSNCEIAVAHNGDKFDWRRVKDRFLFHGFPPMPPIQTVDTKKILKRETAMFSNALNDAGQYLGLGQKVQHTGINMWRDCRAGDMKQWRLMARYCAQDTRLLESLYKRIRTHDRHAPNVNILMNRTEGCSKCGGRDIVHRGYRMTKTGRYRRYFCNDCGGYSHGGHVKVTEIR